MSFGVAGTRYSAYEVAQAWGVSVSTVVSWIKRKWLTASETTNRGYRIRLRALRRLILDYPSVAITIANARHKRLHQRAGAQAD
jgi:hypothetical protein